MPNTDHPYLEVAAACRQYGATLVAVSKTRTIREIENIYQMGQRIFAENRVQELISKAPVMPKDIEWHLIGHLQTNKVRSLLPYVDCIQSLDRLSLWETIEEEASRISKPVRCLLQIKVAQEETKFGWDYNELIDVLESIPKKESTFVRLEGIMGMASLTEDTVQVRQELRQLRSYFDQLKAKYFAQQPDFSTVSMGMSGDYLIALEEGSTMVRIGSLLFP